MVHLQYKLGTGQCSKRYRWVKSGRLTLKRFMNASRLPISSETSFINDLYCASSLIHAEAYLHSQQNDQQWTVNEREQRTSSQNG